MVPWKCEARESQSVWGVRECLTDLPWGCLVSIWIETVPRRVLCWNTQVPAGDSVLSRCRTSGRWVPAGCLRGWETPGSLQTALVRCRVGDLMA